MDKEVTNPSIVYERETGEGSQAPICGVSSSPAYVKWLENNVILGEFEAHVICCNDEVKRVILGSLERAKRIKEELSEADYNYYHTFDPAFDNYTNYRKRMFWHIHTVKGSL
jgi:hypothetical protein